MENWQKGEIAELKVILRAVEKGMIVCKPVIPSTRYDLILDDGSKLVKAQIKWAGYDRKDIQGSVSIDLRKLGVSREYRHYNASDFDILLVYVPPIDKICIFRPETYLGRVSLRISYLPTKSGQKRNCLVASDHEW